MPLDHFVRLRDVVLVPPVPAVLSVLIACGLASSGSFLARRLRHGQPLALDMAAGFVLASAACAAVVHALALAQWSTIAVLRPLGWSMAIAGAVACVRHRRPIAVVLGREVSALSRGPRVERIASALVVSVTLGLAAAALGPPTDADSLDYHLGIPLDWLGHGGAFARHDWLVARLAGLGESLNLLGLASGTDSLGGALQFGGFIAVIVALRAAASTTADRLLATLLVVACPVMAFLVPSQKPQMLPVAATTIALMLVVRRQRTFDNADAWLVFGCTAFAAAAKTSFLSSAGAVGILGLIAARRNGRLWPALTIASAAYALVLAPVLLRNLIFFGDPISPFLERFMPLPDDAIRAFAVYLRSAAVPPTLSNLLRLPLDMIGTLEPAHITTTLGLGVAACVPLLLARPRNAGWLVGPALIVAASCLCVGQWAPRFFVEPYLWIGAALVASPLNRGKRWLTWAIVPQAALATGIALFAAATLGPGALTSSWRESVMARAAAGYAEARWLDDALPADAVVFDLGRFHALMPRPFVAADVVMFDESYGDYRALARLAEDSGANTLIVRGPGADVFSTLARHCGDAITPLTTFVRAARNPLNAIGYDVQVFRLRGCD